ncbi:hypothetical protein FB451DRAFT_1396896 [Mycena latifolia]|nr:hypothetical protein FB451DRAFT_1396896 [Mycena latifolia]
MQLAEFEYRVASCQMVRVPNPTIDWDWGIPLPLFSLILLMVGLGAPWEWVLCWGTLGGADRLRAPDPDPESEGDNAVRFGCVRPGWAADIVGLDGDIAADFASTVRRVEFVMKGGRVYKRGGKEVSL